jgi:serine/threonine protein kinase
MLKKLKNGKFGKSHKNENKIKRENVDLIVVNFQKIYFSLKNRSYGIQLAAIIQFDANVSHERKRNIFLQSINGLDFLHKLGIVHKNLNPKNILISAPNEYGIELVKLLFEEEIDETYSAPELILGKSCTRKSDIFSLGCVFHFLIHNGKHPFNRSIGKSTLDRLTPRTMNCLLNQIISINTTNYYVTSHHFEI